MWDFTSFILKDNLNNNVSISNVKGFKPTETFKVSISYLAGYKASGQLTVSGPNAFKKAELTSKIIWERLKNNGYIYEDTKTEYLGGKNLDGNNIKDIKEIIIKLSVKDKSIEKVNRFGKEIAPVITNGPPGITGFSGGRPKAQEVIAYWPCLIPKKLISTSVSILWKLN